MPNRKCDTQITNLPPISLDPLEGEAELHEVDRQVGAFRDVFLAVGRADAYRNVADSCRQQEGITYKMLKEFKGGKGYKGYLHEDPDGNLIRIRTWEEFCSEVLRKSRVEVDKAILDIEALGVEIYQQLVDAGVAQYQISNYRRLPDATRKGVIDELEKVQNQPELIKSIVVDALTQYESEKTSLRKALDEAKADNTAKDRVIEDKSKLLDEKNRELDDMRLIKDRENLTEEQRQQALRQQVLDRAVAAICAIGAYEDAIIELYEAKANTASTPDTTMAQFNAIFEDLEIRRERQGFGSHRQFFITDHAAYVESLTQLEDTPAEPAPTVPPITKLRPIK